MGCDAMNAISMESTWIGLIIDRIERYIEDTCTLICVAVPAIQPACSSSSHRYRDEGWFLLRLFVSAFFYYFYEWQSKIVQHINRSNWIKADPQYIIICDTHTHTHIVTLLNLRFGRYVLVYWQEKNLFEFSMMLLLACIGIQQEQKKRIERHDNTRTHCQRRNIGNKETKSGRTQMKIPPHAKQFVLFACIEMLPFFSFFICCRFIPWNECLTKQIGYNQRKSK